jgi:hypothetical protein
MVGVRKEPKKGGKYQGWFIDDTGTRKFFHGTCNRAETLRITQRLEDEHRQIRLGYRPTRTSADKYRHSSFTEVKDEYTAWGIAQGGRDGRPWGKTHIRNRHTHLEWWQGQLGLETLADVEGILPRVEEALRALQAQGRAGKALANYAEALAAFCDWCVQRGYLAVDPLQSLGTFDTTPRTQCRAMTAEEITTLLRVCAPHRRIIGDGFFIRAAGERTAEPHHGSPRSHPLWAPSGCRLDEEPQTRLAAFARLTGRAVSRVCRLW